MNSTESIHNYEKDASKFSNEPRRVVTFATGVVVQDVPATYLVISLPYGGTVGVLYGQE